MIYVVTYIDVQSGSTTEGIELLKQYREASGAEVFQETCRPNRFVIVETWKDESSFQSHETAAHTASFRASLRAIQNSPHDQRVHQGFSVGTELRPLGAGKVFVVTHVDVPPARKDETGVLLTSLAEQSRKENGNVVYDVFQQKAPRTNHFTVFATWNNDEAFASHEMQPHTRQFREALAPMLGAPYDERLYSRLS